LRYLYSLILYLMLPAVLLRLWWRGRRVPGYRRHWRERFGFGATSAAGTLWIHAVSVGEVRAAEPLVAAVRRRWPERPLLLTTTTPTGRATAGELFGSAVRCAYLPYDLPGAVRRFLARVSPALAVVMETEIWPNLYHGLRTRKVPLLLVNARLSDASLRRYRWLAGFMKSTLDGVERVAAQTEQDRERFLQLGVPRPRIVVTGNLKFDAALPEDFGERVAAAREKLAPARPCWVAGSTHGGEETRVLEAHRRVLERVPTALLLLVPRHPERASEVASLCARAGFGCRLYSRLQRLEAGDRVVIVDTLGDLAVLYGLSPVAFVGGSLVGHGGHNPLEAFLAGAAVVAGPHVENFRQVYDALLECGVVQQIETDAELAQTVSDWLGDESARSAVVAAGRRVIEAQRGAVDLTMELLDALLADT
jgi:3-deoxy-D-manno-octulosonic-acid transferase